MVKKLRLQRGWSQDQLSQLSGLSIRTIQRIEKGQNPGLESLKSLAAVFELPITDLQGDTDMTTQDREEKSAHTISLEERLAFHRVQKMKGFYIHLTQYCLIIPVLFAINLFTHPSYIWAVWPMLGWGVGLAFHGLRVFNVIKCFGPEWEKRQVEKQLGRKL
nr:helix-turn-helix domain-containing protein [Marinomonas spartinae]